MAGEFCGDGKIVDCDAGTGKTGSTGIMGWSGLTGFGMGGVEAAVTGATTATVGLYGGAVTSVSMPGATSCFGSGGCKKVPCHAMMPNTAAWQSAEMAKQDFSEPDFTVC